jgi:hypothetical protein
MQAKNIAIPIGLAFSASLSIKSLTSIPISFPVDAIGQSQGKQLSTLSRRTDRFTARLKTKCAREMKFFSESQ